MPRRLKICCKKKKVRGPLSCGRERMEDDEAAASTQQLSELRVEETETTVERHRHNPGVHYEEGQPKRQVTQTDHLNAKLLSAFDKLLESGAFSMPATKNESNWSDVED